MNSNESVLSKLVELQQIIIQTQSEVITLKNKTESMEREMKKKDEEYEILKKELKELKEKYGTNDEENIDNDTSGLSVNERKMNTLFSTLKKWSGKDNMTLLYDSDVDPISCTYFQNIVLNRACIYIILFDEKGNIFGCYNRKSILKIGVRMEDRKHFVFSLDSNGRIDSPKRFLIKEGNTKCFFLNGEGNNIGRLCEIGTRDGFISVARIGLMQSGCVKLSETYLDIDTDDLNGTNNVVFKLSRIMVLQME